MLAFCIDGNHSSLMENEVRKMLYAKGTLGLWKYIVSVSTKRYIHYKLGYFGTNNARDSGWVLNMLIIGYVYEKKKMLRDCTHLSDFFVKKELVG